MCVGDTSQARPTLPSVRYDLVVFDFDGTLADSFPFVLEVMGTLADAHGFRRLADDELDTVRGWDARRILKHIGLPVWKMPRVGIHFKSLMAASIERIALFEGMADVLRVLAAERVRLALVTSNSRENVTAVLGAELAPLFAHYECGVDVFGKRAKLRRTVRALGVARERVLCIGDEVRDAEAASAEDYAFGAVTWGYTNPEALMAHAPAHVFALPGDIVAALGIHQ